MKGIDRIISAIGIDNIVEILSSEKLTLGVQFGSLLFRDSFLYWPTGASGLSAGVWRPVDTSR